MATVRVEVLLSEIEAPARLIDLSQALSGKLFRPEHVHSTEIHNGCSPDECNVAAVLMAYADRGVEIAALRKEIADRAGQVVDAAKIKALQEEIATHPNREAGRLPSPPVVEGGSLPVGEVSPQEALAAWRQWAQDTGLADRWPGPCAHGREPYTRCEICSEMTEEQARALAEGDRPKEDGLFFEGPTSGYVITNEEISASEAPKPGDKETVVGAPGEQVAPASAQAAPLESQPSSKATGISSLEGLPPASGDGANLDEYGAPYSDQANAEHGRALDLLRSDTHAAVNVSYMQTKLRMPFNRTQRLLERLEREGVVGPPESDGYSGRVVLKIPASTGVSPLLPDEVDGARELLVQGERIADVSRKVIDRALAMIDEDIAELEGLQASPAVPEPERTITEGKVVSNEVAPVNGAGTPAEVSHLEQSNEAEGNQGLAATSGTGHPDTTATDQQPAAGNAAVEKKEVAPSAGLAPEGATSESGSGIAPGMDSSGAPAAVPLGPAPLSMAGRKWGHNGKGSAWHVWPATVEGSQDESGEWVQTAPCNEEVQGTILYADRPIADNACLDCAAMVGWDLSAELAPTAVVSEPSVVNGKVPELRACGCGEMKKTHSWRGFTETKTNDAGQRSIHGWKKCIPLCKAENKKGGRHCEAAAKADGYCGRHSRQAAKTEAPAAQIEGVQA